MSNLTDEELARFNAKWAPAGQCWIWQGPLDRDGYGTFYFRRRGRRAHRVAWFMRNGEVPQGHVINHTCRNRACVNPQHLQAMTVAENNLKDSTSIPYLNSQKTTCAKGHPFDTTAKSTWKGKVRIARVCSICQREKQKRLRQKWRAEDTLNV